MARSTIKVLIPRNPDDLFSLTGNVLAKHTLDGAASVIPTDVAAELQTLYTKGLEQHELQKNLYRDAENYIEQRNLALGTHYTQDSRTPNTVKFYVTSARDVLAGLNRSNLRHLGKWGYTVNSPNNISKVVIPTKTEKLLELSKKVMDKHAADGASSPLPNADITALSALYTNASNYHKNALEAYKLAEDATEKRNRFLGLEKNQGTKATGNILYIVTSIRTLLRGYNRGNEQNLGNWGYTVNTSAARGGNTPATPPEE
ncbi:MAG TPA: hypothetical protein PK239_17905 [Chitinophagales bacterium]|nr:hypothetical protein [Chitinophagales bacterium]